MIRVACRSCGARIIWAVTRAAGKAMPVDAEPDPTGNVIFTGSTIASWAGVERPEAVVLTQADMFTDPSSRHTSHFATCPDADAWRNR